MDPYWTRKRKKCSKSKDFTARRKRLKSQKLNDGERGWIRTSDPRLKRALLYQLSYAPTLVLIYHTPQNRL